jgi:hypothetical protein
METLLKCPTIPKSFKVVLSDSEEKTFETLEKFIRLFSPITIFFEFSKINWKRFVLAVEGTSVVNIGLMGRTLEAWMLPSQTQVVKCSTFPYSFHLKELHTLLLEKLDVGDYDHISHLYVEDCDEESPNLPNVITFAAKITKGDFTTKNMPKLETLCISVSPNNGLFLHYPLEHLETGSFPKSHISIKKMRYKVKETKENEIKEIFSKISGLEVLIHNQNGVPKTYGIKNLVSYSS